MHKRFLGLALLVVASVVAHEHGHACKSCGQKTYGTSIEWIADPSQAAHQAKKEEKLVFVLHVSGHFEDPGVT